MQRLPHLKCMGNYGNQHWFSSMHNNGPVYDVSSTNITAISNISVQSISLVWRHVDVNLWPEWELWVTRRSRCLVIQTLSVEFVFYPWDHDETKGNSSSYTVIRQVLSAGTSGTENQNPSSMKFAFGGALKQSLSLCLLQRYLTQQTNFHDLFFAMKRLKTPSKHSRLLSVLKRISN